MSAPDLFMRHEADFSPCRTWRYLLTRTWDDAKPPCCWIMLNPSLANELRGDPTTTRCVDFANRWGYGAHWAVNLFAFVSAKPRLMFAAVDPVGPQNDEVLAQVTTLAQQRRGAVVLAWGAAAAAQARALHVQALIARLGVTPVALGLTKDGHPRHPLYMPKTAEPTSMKAAA